MDKFSSITDALKWRYATMKFDTTKEISDEAMEAILTVGNLAPTSFGLQPFKFVVVDNQEKRNALVEHSWGQEHVAKNSRLLAIAIDTNIDDAYVNEYADRVKAVRGLTEEQLGGYREMMIGGIGSKTPEARAAWARNQAYIALGAMIAKASEMGIDNHALEGFSATKYNEILGLDEKNLNIVVILALGYRAEDDMFAGMPKVRKDLSVMTVSI